MRSLKITFVLAIAILAAFSFAVWLTWIRPFGTKPVFERVSGFKLPKSALVVGETIIDGGLAGSDTSRCINVQIDSDTAKKWSGLKPMNGAAEWKSGKITEAIPRGNGFVPEDVLNSEAIQYSIFEKADGSGDLLVLDLNTNNVWLLLW